MPISALPEETARVLTSSVALNDAVSLVKELIDNALDARATAVVIELSTNTTDIVQVKDNGTGIGVQDRQLLCKSGCTSKIRTLEDLASLGGESLGFRGEALASACNVSGSVLITTRVEGEIVGTALKYGPGGKMVHSASASHAVGTTVRVQDFLSNVPVRKQTAQKNPAKILTGVRKLLTSYAFARSDIRFSLKVLKAKNDKANWNYAPGSSTSTLQQTASKIVGTEVASQLVAHTISSDDQFCEDASDGYTLEGLLIDPKSDVLKACNAEHYFSVDRRPVSADRDLLEELFRMYKKYLSSAMTPERISNISKPFLSLRINCPTESYDVNIEPAKDRVVFHKPSIVSELLEKLLVSVYGNLESSPVAVVASSKAAGAADGSSTFDLLLARRPELATAPKPSPPSLDRHRAVLGTSRNENGADSNFSDGIALSTRSNHDEEEDTPDDPWTKAKMNIRLLPARSDRRANDRLTTDSASQDENVSETQSPEPSIATPRQPPIEPGPQLLTPMLSPDLPAYQNPGPPIPRRGGHTAQTRETPPPTDRRSTALLESWVQSQRTGLPRRTTSDGSPSPELGARQYVDEVLRPGSTSAVHELHPRRLSTGPSPTRRAQRPFVSPVKRPRPSQFPASQSSGDLTHDHSRNVDRPLPEMVPGLSSGNRQAERELDDILEFERQKKAVSQQRKIALKAMRARHTGSEAGSNGDLSEDMQLQSADTPPRRPMELGAREDFDERFGGEDENSQRHLEAQSQTTSDHRSPHGNNVTAVVSLAGRPRLHFGKHGQSQDQSHAAAQSVTSNSNIPETDPRGYLIQQRKLQQQGPSGDGRPDRGRLKVRRLKTTRLPFEAIPSGNELFDLATTIRHDIAQQECSSSDLKLELRGDTKRLEGMDEYVQSGRINTPKWAANNQDITRWEQELTTMIKSSYRSDMNPTADSSSLDFSVALAKRIKAHVDEHGNCSEMSQ